MVARTADRAHDMANDRGAHRSAQGPADTAAARVRKANVRTALLLAAIALVFFVGILAVRLADDTATGMTVLGIAVLVFLVIAIGRNLRK
jgi:hypothetical protein